MSALCSHVQTLAEIGYDVYFHINDNNGVTTFSLGIFNGRLQGFQFYELIAGDRQKYTADDLAMYCNQIINGYELNKAHPVGVSS